MNRMKLDKSRFETTIHRKITTPKITTPKITTSNLIRCPYCHSKILDESIEICEMCGEVLNNNKKQ